MALTAEIFGKSLRMRCQTGVDGQGSPVIKVFTFKAKADALDADIFAVANSINTLQAATLVNVYKQEDHELQDDGL
ncbi:hypothetical protein JCM14036_30610 [Desulfotomaculum defluvii]